MEKLCKREELAELLSVSPQSITNYTKQGMQKESDNPPRWLYTRSVQWLRGRGKRDIEAKTLSEKIGVTCKTVKEWVSIGCPFEITKEGVKRFNLSEVTDWGKKKYGEMFGEINKVMEG